MPRPGKRRVMVFVDGSALRHVLRAYYQDDFQSELRFKEPLETRLHYQALGRLVCGENRACTHGLQKGRGAVQLF